MDRWGDIAARQHGLISVAQLVNLGTRPSLIRRRVDDGVLEELLPGVLRVLGSPGTWHQKVMAAVLWSGDGVASQGCAGAVWGLAGCPQAGVEIATDKQSHRKANGFTIHRLHVPQRLTTRHEGIPVTNVVRTLVDLGVPMEAQAYGRAIEDALRRGLTSPGALRRYLERERRRGRPGVGILRAWLDAGGALEGPSASGFQRQVRQLLKEAGSFREEVEIRDANGVFLARADFGHETLPLLVEADGRKDHSGRDDWYQDLRRRRRVTSQGYFVLHVMPQDLATPEGRAAVLAEVRASLARLRATSLPTGEGPG